MYAGLPRRGHKPVSVYSHALSFSARPPRGAELAGFNVLVGGGLGRTHNKPETYPAVARPLAFVATEHLVETARAVVAVQRDFGDRSNRRHARLKYLLADHGLPWFREQVRSRVGFELSDPWPLRWKPVDDHLGWHEQGDGRLFYGLFVENGRIKDEGRVRLKSALRQLVEEHRPVVWMTPQQNLIVGGVDPARQPAIESLLREYGVPLTKDVSNTLRNSMACPAIPTCGLAVAEAERVLPELIRQIERIVAGLGLADERISFRMTGCPNGCARPYIGDVGFVGTTLGKYDVHLGGDFLGTRLNALFARNVQLAEIPALLEGPLAAFASERTSGEGFGDWCQRIGVDALRDRFRAEAATA